MFLRLKSLQVIPPLFINIVDLWQTEFRAMCRSGRIHNSIYNSLPTYSPLSGIYMLLITGPLSLGITLFFLLYVQKNRP